MKEPIQPMNIRAGDLIRKEYNDPESSTTAIEYRARDIGDVEGDGTNLFLLDRPEPAVVLPTEPGTVIDSRGDYFALDIDGRWTNLWDGKDHEAVDMPKLLASRGDGSVKVIARPVAEVAAEVLAEVVRESGLINTSSPQWLKVAAKWGVTK